MNYRVLVLLLYLLAGCSSDSVVKDGAPDHVSVDVMNLPDAVPHFELRTRAGNPKSYRVLGRSYHVLTESKGYRQRGIASWYGTKFHGKKTANGETYDMYAMTAAHKTLPIPSYVRVTNLNNGRGVVVRINDRGPFHDNRIIDLSYAAAVKLGIQRHGTGFVEIEALEPGVKAVNQEKTIVNDKLYLQIGAFSNRFNAQQLQRKVADIHFVESLLKVAQHQGDTLYKVLLGPVSSVEMADRLTERLIALGVTSSTLVNED